MSHHILSATTRILAATTITGGALVGVPGTALSATPTPVQTQVDQQLRTYPGGVQTGPGEVSYNGGAVKVVIPDDSRAAAAACPGGWYCFYENNNLGGRRLQFRDCGGTQYLTNYGFGNQTSSWQNTTKHTVYAYDNAVTPPTHLWTEEPTSEVVSVGAEHDNRADSFYTACG
jgi:hypothetical protein